MRLIGGSLSRYVDFILTLCLRCKMLVCEYSCSSRIMLLIINVQITGCLRWTEVITSSSHGSTTERIDYADVIRHVL
jgi:hypothetical protein